MYAALIKEYEGQFGNGRSIDDIVSLVESLPPLPDIAAQALRLLDDPNVTPAELAAVLRRDPAFAAATLRLANSSAFGRAETISELDEAIMVVGLTSLKSMTMAVALKRSSTSSSQFDKLVWQRSVCTAAAAQVVATHLGKTYQAEAHLCGLLHNLGQIVLLSNPETAQDYQKVFEYIREHRVDYAEAERNVVGFSHPLVGSLVARRWQLPYATCLCILHHSDPFEGISTKTDEQIALTKLAAGVALCAGHGRPEGHPETCSELQPVALALGMNRETLAADKEVVIRQTQALYATEASAYGG